MPIKLDLSKVKFLKSLKGKTVLQHADGHLITLAHNALDPAAQKQLEALAETAKDFQKADFGKVGVKPDMPQEIGKVTVKESPKKTGLGKVQMAAMAPMVAAGPQVQSPGDFIAQGYDAYQKNVVTPIADTLKKTFTPDMQVQGQTMPTSSPVSDFLIESASDPINYIPGPAGAAAGALETAASFVPNKDAQPLAKGGSVGDSVTPDIMSLPSTKPDPAKEALQSSYNRLVSAESDAVDSFGMPVGEATGADKMFWPGAKPTNFQSDAYVEAKQQMADAGAQNQGLLQTQAAQTEQDNQVRMDAGLEPLPMPTGYKPQPSNPMLSPKGLAAESTQSAAIPTSNAYDPMAGIQSSTNDVLKGLQGQAQGLSDLGNAQALALQAAQQADNEAFAEFNAQHSAVLAENEALQQDIRDGHINPDKFWTGDPKTGEGSHSKIMTGIGMILAGFNPTNSPNAAIAFLDKQMDRNLEAQRRNLSSKESLLAANAQKTGNIQAAYQLTRAQLSGQLANKLAMEAAKAQGPMAKAAAMQAAGQFKAKANEELQKYAAAQTVSNLEAQAAQDPSRVPALFSALQATDPKKAEDYRQRLIPGVNKFANTKEDATLLKEVVARKSSIESNADKAINLIKKAGTYEALGPHNATINMLADQIATDFAKMQDPQSAARPGEVEMVKRNLIEAGLSGQNKTAIAQLKRFYDTVEQRQAAAFSARGIQPPQSKAVGAPQDGMRGTLKDGTKVIKVNGKWVKE